MYLLRILLLFITALIFVTNGTAQTTIWSVDFETGYSDNDETAQDNNSPTGADWTKTGTPTDWWRVESNNAMNGSFSMQAKETDGVMTWTSEAISISGFTNVTISIDMEEVNWDNGGSDQMETFYNIDGGGNTEFGDGNGDGNFNNVTNTIAGLSGSSLVIVVTLNCNANNERGRFDDILVTGTPALLGKDGPGGVGETDGSGELELWLIAEGNTYTDLGSTAAADGQDVQQWNDQSGNNHHATEATTSERPDLNTNSVNGFSSVTFDGSDDRILSTGLTTNDEATVFAVFQLNAFTANTNDGIIQAGPSGTGFSGTGSDKTIGMWVNVSSNDIWGRGVESGGTQQNISQVTSLSTGQFYVISQEYDGSDINQYVNGAAAGTVGYDGTLQSWTDFGVGRQGSETMDGEIAEVIAFKDNLNVAQRIIVNNYLAAKYGLSLSTGEFYDEDDGANGDFDYEVAGIGQGSDGSTHEDAQGTGIVRVRNPLGPLANNEYFMWGHDNGSLIFSSSDVPSGVGQKLVRTWRGSETGEVGTVTISFDLSNLSGTYSTDNLRLLIDRDNDGSFSDETATGVISGATNTSGDIYEWTGVDMENNQRFSLGVTTLGYLGPGGVGDTDGTGTLSLWLDANQGISETSNEVTQWDDQSGYDNHATPPAAANRPAYDATGTNSHPIITFDGSDDYLTASDDASLDLTNWSIFVIGIVNTHKNYNSFVVKGADGTENYEFLTNFPSTGNFHYPVYYTTTDRSTDSEPDESMSTSVYGVYQLDYDQSNFEFFINGAQTETDAETRTPQTNSNELYIGNEEGVSGRNANASMAEVIIYSSPLNEAQRLIVHNAMSAKYGFSLTSNDLYDEDGSGFDFDVAGIGQASDGTNHLDAQGTGIVRVNTPADMDDSEYLIWGHDDGALSSFGVSDLPTGVEARLARVWRPSETGEVGTVTISFDLSNVFGAIDADDLRLLIDSDNDGLFADESGASIISGAVNTSGDIFEWTGVDLEDNQRFTIGSVDASATPLPIELIAFTARLNYDSKVELKWSTATEINNDFFTIERSIDAENWEDILFLNGAGNSNKTLHYQLFDNEPLRGNSYYRLKQTDFDGQYAYSHIESVRLTASSLKPKIYPNPTEDLVTIECPEIDRDKLRIFSHTGSELTMHGNIRQLNNFKLQIDLSNFKAGMYILIYEKDAYRIIKN